MNVKTGEVRCSLALYCTVLHCTVLTSARRKVEYDMRTRSVLSSSGWARMWVNLVSSAVMQPITDPTCHHCHCHQHHCHCHYQPITHQEAGREDADKVQDRLENVPVAVGAELGRLGQHAPSHILLVILGKIYFYILDLNINWFSLLTFRASTSTMDTASLRTDSPNTRAWRFTSTFRSEKIAENVIEIKSKGLSNVYTLLTN